MSFKKKIFINFSKTIEELVLIFYNTTQDYCEYKTIYNLIHPKHYNCCNVKASHCSYYSTGYDDYDDDENCVYEFAETIQNDRAYFFSSCNDLCRINGVFDKFYSNLTSKKNISKKTCVFNIGACQFYLKVNHFKLKSMW